MADAPPQVSGAADEASLEASLVTRARARDMKAFEQLYRRHVGRAYATAYRMTASARRAEELTQTAFIQAWQKLPDFRAESAFGSWLHRLVVNAVLMDFRTSQRREARVEIVAELEAVTPVRSPKTPAVRLDLEQAIATLPPQARAVFVLHDVEGYTHEEIGGLMSLHPGTTKAQLHRARQLLKEALQ